MSEPAAPPRPAAAVLLARGLGKVYPHQSGPVPVLQDLDLTIRRGEVAAIVGKSGVGKSTLLHVLGTLDRPSSGSLKILGHDISEWPDDKLSAFRNKHVGFIFQFHHLLPEFSALDNAMLPGLIGGAPAAEIGARARDLLTKVGLGHRLEHKPSELSGGEQQRVAVARALAMAPDLVFADEPTGNLDPRTGAEVYDLFMEVSRALGTTVVIATHNPDLARRSDRVLRLTLQGIEEAS